MQGAHQVDQKSTTTTFPARAVERRAFPSRSWRAKTFAGWRRSSHPSESAAPAGPTARREKNARRPSLTTEPPERRPPRPRLPDPPAGERAREPRQPTMRSGGEKERAPRVAAFTSAARDLK